MYTSSCTGTQALQVKAALAFTEHVLAQPFDPAAPPFRPVRGVLARHQTLLDGYGHVIPRLFTLSHLSHGWQQPRIWPCAPNLSAKQLPRQAPALSH